MAAVNAAGRKRARPGGATRARGARSSWQPARASPSSESGERPSVLARPGRARRRSAARAGGLETGSAASFARARVAAGARARRADRQADGDERPSRRARAEEGDVEGRSGCRVGEPLANVGITAAERTLTPAEGRGTVSLTLGNYSDSPARRRVTVVGGRQGACWPGSSTCRRESPRSRFRCRPVCRRCASRCPTMRWLATTR